MSSRYARYTKAELIGFLVAAEERSSKDNQRSREQLQETREQLAAANQELELFKGDQQEKLASLSAPLLAGLSSFEERLRLEHWFGALDAESYALVLDTYRNAEEEARKLENMT